MHYSMLAVFYPLSSTCTQKNPIIHTGKAEGEMSECCYEYTVCISCSKVNYQVKNAALKLLLVILEKLAMQSKHMNVNCLTTY